ncbi:HTH CENPB-type domain-containing protein [Trichonephila inaurata madagascariensis]|uniref:HTH CENPB-type domain-containing protein n=1 Tax=Trichonephila inaurata madagascariensis TaxID=2747483 RepID=A0A8X6J512_9ARAC|nr:HTH CENPB-type domain-containing protein [Trichonephila inaurata madagascariensis]
MLLQRRRLQRRRDWSKLEALPRKSLASKRESTLPGFKVSKERVAAMVGADVSETHSLPLLVISKSKKPRCFKIVSCLPTLYRAQKSAWRNFALFLNGTLKTSFLTSRNFMNVKGKRKSFTNSR